MGFEAVVVVFVVEVRNAVGMLMLQLDVAKYNAIFWMPVVESKL